MTLLNTGQDRVASTIAGMGRDDLKRELLGFSGRFKMDFSEDYLDKLSVERLRHILLAACLQHSRAN